MSPLSTFIVFLFTGFRNLYFDRIFLDSSTKFASKSYTFEYVRVAHQLDDCAFVVVLLADASALLFLRNLADYPSIGYV